MATALPDLGKMTELRQRLLFLVGALVVFRIGTHIPVPVSYTHLDVYKRQPMKKGVRCWLRLIFHFGIEDQDVAKLSMINREVRRARVVAQYAAKRTALKEVIQDLNHSCLLYTSRCV